MAKARDFSSISPLSPFLTSLIRQGDEPTTSQPQHEGSTKKIISCNILTIDYKLHENPMICGIIRTSLPLCNYDRRSHSVCCFICNTWIRDGLLNYYKHICTEQHFNMLYCMQGDTQLEYSSLQFLIDGIRVGEGFQNVKCLLCITEIMNNKEEIEKHIIQITHQINTVSWLNDVRSCPAYKYDNFRSIEYSNIHNYVCELCDYSVPIEIKFIEHLQQDCHIQKLRTLSQRLNFYCCTNCAIFWFGVVEDHYKNSGTMDELIHDVESNLKEKLTKYMNDIEKTLHTEVKDSNELIQLHILLKDAILDNLRNDITSKVSQHVKIYSLGSICTMSPIDHIMKFSVDFNNRGLSPYISYKQLHDIKSYLSLENWFNPYLNPLMSSLLVLNNYRNTPCEIAVVGIDNEADLERDQLIGYFNKVYPSCRHMILLLVNWSRHFELQATVTINAIIWLVIFYLQHISVFPSIMKVRETSVSDRRIKGIYNLSINDPHKCIEQHLFEFFRFYANLNYKHYVICPLLGQLKRKSTFANEMEFLKDRREYRYCIGILNHEEFLESEICLQNPYNLFNMIACNLTKSTAERFQAICACSAQVLKSDQ